MADGDVEIPWVITAASQEDAERAAKDIEQALKSALSATHVAWITVPSGFSAYRLNLHQGSDTDTLPPFQWLEL